MPGWRSLWRQMIYWRQELMAICFVLHPKLMVGMQARFRQMTDQRTLRTVWKSGFEIGYLDAQGKNVTLWPSFTFSYW